jgi:nucleoside-diphosphate-sugar epimerase
VLLRSVRKVQRKIYPAGVKPERTKHQVKCVSADRSTFTILGAGGFIGAALVDWLESHDQVVHAVTRAALGAFLAARRPAGHVIDCIGAGADFRARPVDTADAHVGLVARCLAELRFESFLLLSSTSVYARARATHETATLCALPAEPADLYNLTKLAGEALCLADPRPMARVVRLSNVYGIGMPEETFLGRLLAEGRANGAITLSQGPASAADYINIAAVVRLLPAVAATGRHRIYNVAAGRNTTHAAIADCLRTRAGWRAAVAPAAPTLLDPLIDTARLDAEFAREASDLTADLPTLLALQKDRRSDPSVRPLAA